MENENKPTLEQRVADLELAWGKMVDIVIPALSRYAGETAALNAFVSGLAAMMPPEAPELAAIRQSFENRYVELLNGSVNPEYTGQFETERDRLLLLLSSPSNPKAG